MFTIVGQYLGGGAQVQGLRMEEQRLAQRAAMMSLLSTRVPAQI
jgi:hypothetical protein